MLRVLAAAILAVCFSTFSLVAQAQPEPRFEDYPANAVTIHKVAQPRLKPNTDFWYFRTAIKDGAQEPPNFAGHYILIQWGCGTECQNGVIVDALTGKIFAIPDSALSVANQLDSNLLIVNSDLEADPALQLTKQFYVWEGSVFKLVYEEPSAP